LSDPIKLTAAPRAARRQYLAILFTDVRGSTRLGRQLEVEVFAELLGRVRLIWHAVAAPHGGLVVRTQGDGALVVFGHPKTAEDAGKRAVEAALEMHDQVRRLGAEMLAEQHGALRLRSGIHAGVVLLEEGDVERGRLDLSGDAVNVAAHLQQSAPADGIVASTDALGPHARLFTLGDELDPPPASAPGVRALKVLGRSNAVLRFDATAQRGLTPFIGRQATLETLMRFLATGGRSPACIVLQAGPGMGKTRLLEEFLAHHVPPGWQVLRASCESLGAARPMQAFANILAGSPPAADPESALVPLRAACAPGPTLLVIDDWQWADDASTRLLMLLLREPQRLCLLLAARPRDDGSEWLADAPHFTLEPFDAAQTEAAVRAWLPAADPFLAARIHEHAGGVPLFVEELCHSAAARQLWQPLDGLPGTTGWLGALVASRLSRLPAYEATVVRTAAVIGTVVPLPLLIECCDVALTPTLLQRLAEADFLYPDEALQMLRFKHGVTREAVYASIGLFERTALHRRIEASLLARQGEQPRPDDMSEALSYHARGAGHWELAAQAAELAGDRAGAVHAMDSARRQYRAALDALDRLPQRSAAQDARWCAIAAKLGFACVFDPLSLPDGLAVFERAVLLARQRGDAVALAHATYWLGSLLYATGRFREAAARTRQALQSAQALGDARLVAQIEATLGQVLAATCDYGPAIALMDAALDRKRQSRRPSGSFAVGSAYTLGCKAYVHADQGDFASAQAAFDEALALLGESTHPVVTSTRNWLAIAQLWQGRWDAARHVAAEGVRVATGTRTLLLLACSRAVLGYARWNLGEEDGLEQLREAVRWMSARRCDFYPSLFHGWLAEAAAAAGCDGELRESGRVVLRRRREGERLGETSACRAFALRAARQGRLQAAQRWLRRAERSAALRGSAREAALNDVLRATLAGGGAAEARERLRSLGIIALPRPYDGLMPSD